MAAPGPPSDDEWPELGSWRGKQKQVFKKKFTTPTKKNASTTGASASHIPTSSTSSGILRSSSANEDTIQAQSSTSPKAILKAVPTGSLPPADNMSTIRSLSASAISDRTAFTLFPVTEDSDDDSNNAIGGEIDNGSEDGSENGSKTESSEESEIQEIEEPAQEFNPTPILVQFYYGAQYIKSSHSAVISLVIPRVHPAANSSSQAVTCDQLIDELESKANFPGVRGRLSKYLRSVHVVWLHGKGRGFDHVGPTTVIETLPRSVAFTSGAVSHASHAYADPNHYFFASTLPDYILATKSVDINNLPRTLDNRGGVIRYDGDGNRSIAPYEEKDQVAENMYHGETDSPSEWAKRGFVKSKRPTGRWADYAMLNDGELWNVLQLMAVRKWQPHFVVQYELIENNH